MQVSLTELGGVEEGEWSQGRNEVIIGCHESNAKILQILLSQKLWVLRLNMCVRLFLLHFPFPLFFSVSFFLSFFLSVVVVVVVAFFLIFFFALFLLSFSSFSSFSFFWHMCDERWHNDGHYMYRDGEVNHRSDDYTPLCRKRTFTGGFTHGET